MGNEYCYLHFFDVMTFYVETYIRQSFQNITTNHFMIMDVVISSNRKD